MCNKGPMHEESPALFLSWPWCCSDSNGCRGYHSPFAPPGTMQQQRLNASVYDPYADNDAGPEIVGGRPRDYQKPWSEADRSRASVSGSWGRQPCRQPGEPRDLSPAVENHGNPECEREGELSLSLELRVTAEKRPLCHPQPCVLAASGIIRSQRVSSGTGTRTKYAVLVAVAPEDP